MFLNYQLVMMILMGLLFVGCNQPMSLVIVMVAVTLLYSLYMYMLVVTYWYSFVLMLVMLSGVLVVFTYMASMTPNDKFELMYVPVVFFILLVPFTGFSGVVQGDGGVVLKLWDSCVMMMNLYIIGFLLVIMLMVVWVSGWWFGPVRVYW